MDSIKCKNIHAVVMFVPTYESRLNSLSDFIPFTFYLVEKIPQTHNKHTHTHTHLLMDLNIFSNKEVVAHL